MSTIKVDTIQSRQHSSSTINLTSTGATVNGDCTATTFSGSGASLTALPAANLTGALPAIDGSNLTGVGGGSLEFVKKISLTANQNSIVEYGLDYDTVYRFNLNHVRTVNYTRLRVFPHVDNSASKHMNGDCFAHYINYSGTTNTFSSNDGWYFNVNGWLTKSNGYFEIYTGADSWIHASINYHSNQGQLVWDGWKVPSNNTNNDPNQTDTYAKVNGVSLEVPSDNFVAGTEIVIYKYKES
tara:strand:- start:320 stop:1042 length:723 start_codon:yes stop_codon:yes gene_type:complete